MATKKKARPSTVKSSVKRRTLNVSAGGGRQGGQPGMPDQDQDVQRRLGNFEGRGEHARVGGRTTGIVGQTKRAFRTDNKRTKSKGSTGKPSRAR